MSATLPLAAVGALSRLHREDFWRRRAPGLPGALPFKEWQHVLVFGEGFELLLNFNLAVAGPKDTETARVIVLARTGAWSGFVETLAPEVVRFSPDGCAARFGSHVFSVEPEGYRVTIDDRARGIAVDLRLRPIALPMVARSQEVAPARRLHWTMYPRLEAHGHIELPGAHFHVTGAPCYHDHNWGRFAWGDDFTWEWGVILPSPSAFQTSPYALVFSRLANRSRTLSRLDQLFLWRGPRNVLAASGPDTRVESIGQFRGDRPLRLPKVMSLLRSRHAGDVPSTLRLKGRQGEDFVEARFVTESTAEILMPSETDPLAATAIHECAGAAHVEGRLGGEAFTFEGRGVFEFVRH